LVGLNSFTIEQEPKRIGLHAATLRVRVKDFGHFGCLFDFEKRFFTGLF
jgi:hypothetical protein